MTQAALAESPAATPAPGLQLVLIDCPLCGEGEGEPVAVGKDFAHGVTQDSFLVLACGSCGLLYLNPRPGPEERRRLYPAEYFRGEESASRTHQRPCVRALLELVRSCRIAKPSAHVLEVGYGPTLHVTCLRQAGPGSWVLDVATPHSSLARAAEGAGCRVYETPAEALDEGPARYDLVVLVYALEHCAFPLEELASLRRLLRPGGRLVVVTPNAGSRTCRLFRGRHWTGYDFPRHPCLYDAGALRRLAEASGFTVERLRARNHGGMWVRSAENFLADWAVPAWVRRLGAGMLPLLSGPVQLAERLNGTNATGAQLEAILRKPAETEV